MPGIYETSNGDGLNHNRVAWCLAYAKHLQTEDKNTDSQQADDELKRAVSAEHMLCKIGSELSSQDRFLVFSFSLFEQ